MNTSRRSKSSALLAFIGVCMALACNIAAADDRPHCKRIKGVGFLPEFQLPCVKDPSFFACLLGSTRGTLKSTWEVYVNQPGVDLSGFELPIPAEAGWTGYQSEHDVFITRRGTITGYSHYVFDERMTDSGGFTNAVIVTGGTGIYSDASGWIVTIATDGTLENYVILGEVCGPNIGRDDDGREED